MIAKGKANWVKIATPDTKFNPVYCVDLVVDKKEAAKLEKLGLKTKTDKDGNAFFKFKRDVAWPKSGEPKDKPVVFDAYGDHMDPSIVGNGSECEVHFQIIKGSGAYGPYSKVDFQALVVHELIEYHGSGGQLNITFKKKDDEEDVPF